MTTTQKFFPNVKSELARALVFLFEHETSSSKVVQYVLKNNKKWGSRDRRTFAEAFYEVVKHLGFFSEALDRDFIHDKKSLDESSAAKIFSLYEEGFLSQDFFQKDLSLTVHTDLMDELRKAFKNQVDIDKYLKSTLDNPPVFLRVNTIKTDETTLQEQLMSEGVETERVKSSCLKLKERKNIFTTKAFKKGLFEIQDGASQDVAPFLNPQPGSRVLDSCAGAGGKTLHMGALMENRGRLVAMDIFPRRLEELKKRLKRSGLQNVEIKEIESSKTLKRLKSSFDSILLDVPCTGTGTFRRKPEGKYFFTKKNLDELKQSQKEILESHAKLLKSGGELVYATCSILPEENQHQVQDFLDHYKDTYDFVTDKTHPLGERDCDGFYMAKLIKKS